MLALLNINKSQIKMVETEKTIQEKTQKEKENNWIAAERLQSEREREGEIHIILMYMKQIEIFMQSWKNSYIMVLIFLRAFVSVCTVKKTPKKWRLYTKWPFSS